MMNGRTHRLEGFMQMQDTGNRQFPTAPDYRVPALNDKWTFVWSCCVILGLCLIVGLPTIRSDNYFLGDDFGLVHHLHKVPLYRFLSYFVSDWTEGIYGFRLDELRPFLAFTYWLDSRLFGAANAQGYHATNIVLHILNGLLVLAIARSVAPGQKAVALLAASLFVLMPSHAEPISWISGRVDSVAALFYLSAFLCFVRFRLRQRRAWFIATLLVFVCGLFAKQSLVTFPLLILAYDVVYAPALHGATRSSVKSRYASHVPFFLLLAAYLWLRHNLFGNAVREELLTFAAFKEFASRQFFYVTKLLPVADSASSTTRAWLATMMVLLLAACVCSLFVSRSRYGLVIRRLIFFGAVWYAITIAPMVVTYSSARHLYLTSAGLTIALASLILPGRLSAETRWTAGRLIAAAVLVLLYGLALRWNMGRWIENGVESQKFVTALPSLLRSVPRGSIVLIDIPETNRAAWFWSWGLPFALQEPFLPEDLYGQFAIVERPGVYCCPQNQWWAAKQTVLTSLFNSQGLSEVTSILPVPHSPGSLLLATRGVSGPALKLKIESAIGRSVENLSTDFTYPEAQQLMGILLEPHIQHPAQ
jgi:protein O-mannosyl-transferase